MMPNSLEPLHFAIIRSFRDGRARCADDVVAALEAEYAGYKMLTRKDVEEALATAKENGILDEVAFSVGSDGALVVSYRMTDFGRDMIDRYLG